MSSSVPLFDPHVLRLKQARAAQKNVADHPILKEFETRLLERLGEVKKQFSSVLQLGGGNEFTLVPFLASRSTVHHTADPNILSEKFPPHSFDLVLDFLNLQWANQIPERLNYLQHLLKPDGLYLGLFLGGSTLHELRDTLLQAELAVEGGARPRVIPMVNMQDASMLLQRAGFALPMVDKDILTLTYPNLLSLMHDLRAMGLTNPMHQRPRTLRRRTLALAEELYNTHYSYQDTTSQRIFATFEIIYLTGWAPSPTQPQALKPGSGQVSLAKVFKN